MAQAAPSFGRGRVADTFGKECPTIHRPSLYTSRPEWLAALTTSRLRNSNLSWASTIGGSCSGLPGARPTPTARRLHHLLHPRLPQGISSWLGILSQRHRAGAFRQPAVAAQ